MGLVCANCGGDIAVPTKEKRTDSFVGNAQCVDCGRYCKIGYPGVP